MSTFLSPKLPRVSYGLAKLARFFPVQVYFTFILNLKTNRIFRFLILALKNR